MHVEGKEIMTIDANIDVKIEVDKAPKGFGKLFILYQIKEYISRFYYIWTHKL